MENWQSLAVISGAVIVTASSGAVFQPGAWYETLKKPAWIPANWVFPVGWTILYIMIAYAGWRAWTTPGAAERGLAFTVFGLQLVLNALWSAIFFGLRRMKAALIECGFLWLAILLNIILFFPIDVTAALVLVPYLLWVTFAAALNAAVLARNPEFA